MDYKFRCPKCDAQHTVTMSIKEYHADNNLCPDCNTEMERDITDIAGGAIWKCSGAYAGTN